MADNLHDTVTLDLIINNTLKHVPELGWSIEALRLGVQDTGYREGDEYRIFLGNIDRAVEHYLTMIDRKMEERLSELDLSSMRIKDRIATAIMIRLRLADEHKPAVRKTLLYLSAPTRFNLATRSLYNTVNSIWYAAGDTATDFNFYTKRALLAGVYSTTLAYWLEDSSEDSLRTRAFLNRRLDQVLMIPKVKEQLCDAVSLLFKPFLGKRM